MKPRKEEAPALQARASGVTTLERDHEMNSNAIAVDGNVQVPTAQVIPFRSTKLLLIDNGGIPFVPMKPVVDGMGLDWKTQHRKLESGRFNSTMVMMTMVAEDGKRREMSCLPLRKLPGWLMSIHASKVRRELHDGVIAYQNECDDVLWSYWNEGRATRSDDRNIETVLGCTIGADGFQCLAAVVEGKLRRLPAPTRKRARGHLWSQVHKAFSVVSAEQIPASQLEAARNFIGSYAIEGEWLGKPEKTDDSAVSLSLAEASTLYLMMSHLHFAMNEAWYINLAGIATSLSSPRLVGIAEHLREAKHKFKVLDERRAELYTAYLITTGGSEGGYAKRA